MKLQYTLCYALILIFFSIASYSQTKIPKESSLHPPIKIPLFLSGNFGELRTGHFHSGIDIKTRGVSGHKLYAIADGYVSRIKISAGGYGKALYIHHPKLGLTSVYAHLQSFYKELDNHIVSEQYKNKTYEIQLFPEKDEFIIKKGQVIALSGNTGSSKGPHLHFEIRNLSNQRPVNPMFYNFDITDNIPPKIFQVALYQKGGGSYLNPNKRKTIYNTRQIEKGKYVLKTDSPVKVSGKTGFGVKAYDFLNKSHNWCGVYEIELQIDSTTLYHHNMDEFAFQNTRYINAFIDYEEKIKSNANIQKLFLEPNNNLNIYKYVKNNGFYNFNSDTIHRVQINIKDVYGNESMVTFDVKNEKDTTIPSNSNNKNSDYQKVLPFNTENTFYADNIKLDFPVNAFYDTVYFEYNTIKTNHSKFYSDIHQIHNKFTPVHKYFTLALKTREVKPALKDKIFIARIEKDADQEYQYEGGERINGFISTKVREFGDYVVIADTLTPTIKPLTNMKEVDANGQLTFRVIDDLSGIESYNGYINGEWVLFEYDKKNDLLFHQMKHSSLNSDKTHEIELYAGDKKSNIATYYSEFKIK